jgi:hypothetical protein
MPADEILRHIARAIRRAAVHDDQLIAICGIVLAGEGLQGLAQKPFFVADREDNSYVG